MAINLEKTYIKFIYHFQMTCKQLKYSNNLVIAAPSGLALGGGFEVLVQSDFVYLSSTSPLEKIYNSLK